MRRVSLPLLLLPALACEEPFPSFPIVASVTIAPDTATLRWGASLPLTATLRDSAGAELRGVRIVWSSSNPAAVEVAPTGVAFAREGGFATITATAQGVQGTATFAVHVPVAHVTFPAPQYGLLVGAALRLTAVPRDSLLRPLSGRLVTWGSNDGAIATVTVDGLVTGGGTGATAITATSEGVSGSAQVSVMTVRFAAVQPSLLAHTCALSDAQRAWCWGANDLGQLGNGSRVNNPTPVAVAGDVPFAALTGGGQFSCGLGASGTAFCWGSGARGRLGNGSISGSTVPVAVVGGFGYGALASGWNHSCAAPADDVAQCWGGGGALGSDVGKFSTVPVAVPVRLAQVSAGDGFSCGLAPDGTAWCWGRNSAGELGDGTLESTLAPVAVQGGLRFTTLTSGPVHSCGLTAAGEAWCWGANDAGQLGTGALGAPAGPVPVAGGHTFRALSAGTGFTCGVTASDEAWCWGSNWAGQLGDGTTTDASQPVRAAPGLRVQSVAAGGVHACVIALDGLAWCWGDNRVGQLGDGTTTARLVPVRVIGQTEPVP